MSRTYEKACILAEKIFPISPPKETRKKYEEAIKFSHLNITPVGAFSLAILATLLIVSIPMALIIYFDLIYPGLILLILVFAAVTFYLLYDYPLHYATTFKINASAEMALCIVYIATSMKISPNLEKAIEFAAKNLRGPLAYDLKLLLWNVLTGKHTLEEVLDEFMDKWKRENEEFTEALYLIKTSSVRKAKREEILNEAIRVMLDGTKEKMQKFARELSTPVTAINALGILLPLIGITFFPLMSIFLPELVQPSVLIVGYVVILPLVVFLLMKSYLEKRPYTFHQPDITKHPKFRKEKFLSKDLFVAIFIATIGIYLGWSLLLPIEARFTSLQLYFSFIITWGIVLGVAYFAFSKVRGKLELRDEIARIESEFPEALVLVGTRLSLGVPLENVLDETVPKIKHLKVSGFFKNILHNIRTLNMNFEQAIFDKTRGAIIFYPSTILTAIMKAVTDIYAKGAEIVSKTMVTVSQFLKNVHSVEENLKDMLSEVTSSIHLQMLLLAPLSTGVVVALAAIITEMIMILGSAAKLYEKIAGYGALSAVGGGILAGFINTEKILPVHVLQVTIGVYLIEIVALMASFASRIENGEENILKMRLVARMVLLAALIYTVVAIGLYSTISSMLSKFFVRT
jgi:Flp pilus assembly protein TadB